MEKRPILNVGNKPKTERKPMLKQDFWPLLAGCLVGILIGLLMPKEPTYRERLYNDAYTYRAQWDNVDSVLSEIEYAENVLSDILIDIQETE